MRKHHHPARPRSTRASRPSNRGKGDISDFDVRVRFNSAADIICDDELDLLQSILPDLIKTMMSHEKNCSGSDESTECGTHPQSDHVVYEAEEN
ncbi:MAG: hypothetical protein K2P67_04255 [Gallionellaceae bacterium]|nr:hypothetical protein [Gallionellaceae bacterium]